jgi:hypothetical protein
MKVKINNIIYNSEVQPIMMILNNQDRKNISEMDPTCTKYCSFPDNYNIEDVKKFMQI